MDMIVFFNIIEITMFSFIFGYFVIVSYYALPFLNAMRLRYELKGRLFFINYLIMKRILNLNKHYRLKQLNFKIGKKKREDKDLINDSEKN